MYRFFSFKFSELKYDFSYELCLGQSMQRGKKHSFNLKYNSSLEFPSSYSRNKSDQEPYAAGAALKSKCIYIHTVLQICWNQKINIFLFCFVSFQDYTHSIGRFPGQGSNWICSHRPRPQPQQHWILTTSVTYTTAHSNDRSLKH